MVFHFYIKTKSFCLKYGPFLTVLVNKILLIQQTFLKCLYASSVRSVLLKLERAFESPGISLKCRYGSFALSAR